MHRFSKNPNKIVVILGPTSSGKTRLAVSLAQKFNGEIVSADSRQVYKGMDIGTGKDLDEYKISNCQFPISNKKSQIPNPKSQIFKIPYHLIDVVSPKTEFNLAKYQKLAFQAIDDILTRKKLPILVGGTGLYLQAIIDGYILSSVKPDKKLRAELEKKSVAELFSLIKKINKKFADKINESDRKNKRRLIRYVEILKTKKLVSGDEKTPSPYEGEGGVGFSPNKYNSLIIGLSCSKEILNERIHKRLIERLEKEDMVGEVKRLKDEGLSWKRLESFGLEYKFIGLYLQDKINYDDMVEKLFIAIRQFARRQMTWFRRWERQGAKIHWLDDKIKMKTLINNFLK
jgi:tRNA dimethylallyltransferase